MKPHLLFDSAKCKSRKDSTNDKRGGAIHTAARFTRRYLTRRKKLANLSLNNGSMNHDT